MHICVFIKLTKKERKKERERERERVRDNESLRVSIRPNDCTQSSLASERVTGLPEHFPSQKKLGCFAYVSFYIFFEKRSNFLLKSQQLLNVHVRVCVCFSDRWCVRDR